MRLSVAEAAPPRRTLWDALGCLGEPCILSTVVMGVPCYSARFIQPFAEVLARHESFDPRGVAELRAIDPAERISIATAHDMVLDQIEQTGDQDLGIKAARLAGLGQGGVLDYAMNSAATVRKMIETGARYTRLFSDSLRVQLEIRGNRAFVRLGTTVPAPRAVPDFAMAYWYSNHTKTPLGDAPKIECWFEHPTPVKTHEYDRAFGNATLNFGAPFYGFAFDREYLDAPLSTSDPTLHVVFHDHVAKLESLLTDPITLSHRVREIATKELLNGTPTLTGVARELHMTPRMLTDRLQREGATFSGLLDQVKRDLAIGYLRHPELTHTEIAFRLGFAHVEAFYRAFKRWTGETPFAYRRARPSSAPRARFY